MDDYRQQLSVLDEWEPFLLSESGLPGRRGNIELGQAVAEEGDEPLFLRLLAFDAYRAPTNTPEEFLAFCGILGLGKLLSEGRSYLLPRLRASASDPRWRAREAMAMALQRWGRVEMGALLKEMAEWAIGSRLEQRAAAAGLCEPDLLSSGKYELATLQLLDRITATLVGAEDRRTDAFRALRKGMGYCWSVAVVALPDEGKRLMEERFPCDDPDVRWVMRENLRKKRLERLDPEWVATSRILLGMS